MYKRGILPVVLQAGLYIHFAPLQLCSQNMLTHADFYTQWAGEWACLILILCPVQTRRALPLCMLETLVSCAECFEPCSVHRDHNNGESGDHNVQMLGTSLL